MSKAEKRAKLKQKFENKKERAMNITLPIQGNNKTFSTLRSGFLIMLNAFIPLELHVL